MRTAEQLEIAWRKELLKRLRAPMNTLKRQMEREKAQRNKRTEQLREYSSPEDAHDAYGYGLISYEEYQQILTEIDSSENEKTPVSLAYDELESIIRQLHKDIRYFEWEALSDHEKRKIEKKNMDYYKSIESRKGR